MQLKSLSLTNFRSYPKFAQDFGETVLFVGANGIGKTNLLEAIYLLAVMKSFRADSDAETIRFGADFAKIGGRIADPIGRGRPATAELEIVIHEGEKRAKKNGAAKPLSQLIGTLKAVLFAPDQLEIVSGAPRSRRRFLDMALSQTDRRYTQALLSYQKALKQRNALLLLIKQGGASTAELPFWDKELVAAGAYLSARRQSFLEKINSNLGRFYETLAGSGTDLIVSPHLRTLSLEALQNALSHDINFGATSVGPHRDNFLMELRGRDLAIFGSRGEWRTSLLALKMAEFAVLQQEAKTKPLLLLDDVFSELDARRRQRLLANLDLGQTFLTTTDLPKASPRQAQVVEIAEYAAA